MLLAVNGVTGKAGSYRDDLDHHLAQLHEIASIPVLTGFGVSSMEDIHRFNKVSDGVIVGSKIVKALHQGETEAISSFYFSSSERANRSILFVIGSILLDQALCLLF